MMRDALAGWRSGGRRLVGAAVLAALAWGCAEERSEPSAIRPDYDESGKLRRLTYDSNADGKPDMWSFMDGARVQRVEVDSNEDGQIDRWEYFNASQVLEKVAIAAKRDGKVSRTEFYEAGILARAEEDVDGNGKVDKWETYADGGVTSVALDTEGAGRPTRRLVYGVNGKARAEKLDGAGNVVK